MADSLGFTEEEQRAMLSRCQMQDGDPGFLEDWYRGIEELRAYAEQYMLARTVAGSVRVWVDGVELSPDTITNLGIIWDQR